MRAADILLFCLCVNAAMSFVNTIGVFSPQDQWVTAKTGSAYDLGLGNINSYDTQNLSWGEMVQIGIIWLVETTLFVIRFLVTAAIIVPAMAMSFGIPWNHPVVLMLQAGLYFIYMWGIIQWKSGKSLFSYQ